MTGTSSDDRLLKLVSRLSGDTYLKVEEDLGAGFVRLKTAEAERRQAKHDIRHVEDIVIEMLRNARDAHADNIYLATSRTNDMRSLVFIDDGDGIPDELHERVFDARVTSKLDSMVMDRWGVHGRGMALYSIRMNTVSASVMDSAPGAGTAMRIMVDCNDLPERRDQSSFPKAQRDEGEEGPTRILSGPHNIIRTALEFALEESSPTVYLGSPSEICATILQRGAETLTLKEKTFTSGERRPEVYLKPAFAADASELAQAASDLGLEISERTAHRILKGDIAPLRPVLELLEEQLDESDRDEQEAGIKAQFDPFKDRRGLRIARDDLETFSDALQEAFSTIAERYYLDLEDKPQIKVGKDHITVRFDIEKES